MQEGDLILKVWGDHEVRSICWGSHLPLFEGGSSLCSITAVMHPPLCPMARGLLGPRSSNVHCVSGVIMLKVFGEKEAEGSCHFLCTHGPSRPVAAGTSRANVRDIIPKIQLGLGRKHLEHPVRVGLPPGAAFPSEASCFAPSRSTGWPVGTCPWLTPSSSSSRWRGP